MNQYRYEEKYILDQSEYALLYNRLISLFPHLRKEKYIVESHYFDTINLRFFHEKRDGDYLKEKYRKRFYNGDNMGHFEIKKKIADKSLKIKVKNFNKKGLIPVIWIRYKRLGFILDKNFRITFDSFLEVSQDRKSYVLINEKTIICELKFLETSSSVLRVQSLLKSKESFSKYERGMRCLMC